ncbi:hypothetical protein SH668x_003489 [Planctomicrobium sp. SH668]|uniref:hypothetical protein n=1 Tax=Planctomicrobium sp. SH668 TaxID=3448126 RepID=UPI003F5BA0AE
MKTIQRHSHSRSSIPPTSSNRQGGAVIIVVLSLLTTLLFLGLFFYNWTTQEVANSQNFANADIRLARKVNPIPTFNIAAEQLLVGTKENSYPFSAFYGGRLSMLSHVIGRISGADDELRPTDLTVGNGTGILTRYTVDADGLPMFDANGVPQDFRWVYPNSTIYPIVLTGEFNYDRFEINFSRLVPAGITPQFQPDAGYTYPDINSPFLAYEEDAHDPTSSDTAKRRVLIPSFFRPQLFPQLRASSGPGLFNNLYTDPAFQAQVLRPHRSHGYASQPRYLSAGPVQAQSGDRGRTLGAFPFPDDPSFDAAQITANSQMGIFTNTAPGTPYSLLDVDLDLDGTKDAIYIDLDLPMQELPGGREFKPLASFKVIDLDALLNLNVHGNDQAVARLNRDVIDGEPISVSNNGMSRSEVNPLWALMEGLKGYETEDQATYDRATTVIGDAYGAANRPDATQNAANRIRLANMEWRLLLAGYLPSSGEEATVGRYGDRQALNNSILPRPGLPSTDDDTDNGNASGQNGFGLPTVDATNFPIPGLAIPGAVHPMSPVGLGMQEYTDLTGDGYLKEAPGIGAKRTLGTNPATANNPAAWPRYVDFRYPMGSNPDYLLDLMITSPGASLANSLVDEDDETIVDSGNLSFGLNDSPYTAADNAFLQLGNSDHYKAGVSSRLGKLASVNFQFAKEAEKIRRQFTTDSWDRLDFAYPLSVMREEISADPNDGGLVKFPPTFTVTGTQVQPFREEVRILFRTPLADQSEIGQNRRSPRQRLNLNAILSNDALHGAANDGTKGAIRNGNPRYRPLTPHPLTLTGEDSVMEVPMYHGDAGDFADEVIGENSALSFANVSNAGNTYVQEWWARYDRQRLARDIYTLLWLHGSGDENADPLNSNPYASNPERTREMAQFAVNVVDSMDADNVITRFEYDEDLSDGWNTDPASLKVVYGIEHQELAFNEALVIATTAAGTNQTTTEIDDSTITDKHFNTFLELRNAAPWSVDLGQGNWRIRRIQDGGTDQVAVARIRDTRSDKGVIGPGGEYLIGCQDGYNVFTSDGTRARPSEFRLDLDDSQDGVYELVVPNIIEALPRDDTTTPDAAETNLDLDLVFHKHSTFVNDGTSLNTTTSLVNRSNIGSETHVTFVLERSLRPGAGGQVDASYNPWVEVDRVRVEVRDFNPVNLDGVSDLKSSERISPYDSGVAPDNLLFRVYTGANTGVADNDDAIGHHTMPFFQRATVGDGVRRNSQMPLANSFTLWQPHFDRPFTSVMDLLSIPLYGNRGVATTDAPYAAAVNGGASRNVAEPGTPPTGTDELMMSGHRVAAMRFLYPQDADTGIPAIPDWGPSDADPVPHYPNRWYRLLGLVDVDSQNDLAMEKNGTLERRTPGKVNLNTLRNETVLAGLIDDPFVLNPLGNIEYPTRDRFETNRNWFLEHKVARDGRDPFMPATIPNLTIPGGYQSRPFQPLSYMFNTGAGGTASTSLSIESTLLRSRPGNPGHNLYEAAAASDAEGDFEIDYYTRQRILSKISNNTTTRSHVFAVWMGLDYFEAHTLTVNNTNFTQIGSKAAPDLIPSFRMFLVVDMSKLEEAYDPVTGTFNYEAFIIHRQLLP